MDEQLSRSELEADPGPDAAADAPDPGEVEMRRMHDLPIEVGVQLDHRPVRVEELLSLRPDSVIRLSRSAGENVDLLLNGLVAGGGEIVVIDDTMGMRVTEVVVDKDREKS